MKHTSAYESKNGQLHRTKSDCVMHELMSQFCLNDICAKSVVKHRKTIIHLLQEIDAPEINLRA